MTPITVALFACAGFCLTLYVCWKTQEVRAARQASHQYIWEITHENDILQQEILRLRNEQLSNQTENRRLNHRNKLMAMEIAWDPSRQTTVWRRG